jgi:hypothetical protein
VLNVYEIEKGIPVPEPVQRGPWPKYPLRIMQIGDSFFVKSSNEKLLASVINSAREFGSRNKKKFATRLMDGGIRVWRVE